MNDLDVKQQVQSIATFKRQREQLNKELLRERIDGAAMVDGILEGLEFLKACRAITTDAQGIVHAPPPLDSSTISAVKAEIDTRLKLLNKRLPDLKAVEITPDVPGDPRRIMSDTELMHRLAYLGMAVEVEAEPAGEPIDLFGVNLYD